MTASTEPDTITDRDDPRYAALQRLRASRTHLQSALIPPRRQKRSSTAPGKGFADWGGTLRSVWSFVQSGSGSELFQTARGLLTNWWTRHPWHDTVSVVGEAVEAQVIPWVRRNPVTAIAAGVLAGAALAWLRPWRWKAAHSQAHSIRRSATHWLTRELASPALRMLIATSIATWLSQRNANASAAAQTATTTLTPDGPDA